MNNYIINILIHEYSKEGKLFLSDILKLIEKWERKYDICINLKETREIINDSKQLSLTGEKISLNLNTLPKHRSNEKDVLELAREILIDEIELNTSDIIMEILRKKIFSYYDLESSSSRTDSRLTQIIRNCKSHSKLINGVSINRGVVFKVKNRSNYWRLEDESK